MNQKLLTRAARGYRVSSLRLPVVLSGLLMLASCVSTPPAPSESLLAAEYAINTAEQAGVAAYASPELTTARQKLANANAAVNAGEMVSAELLAEQARASAELASAKAELAKNQEVNNDMLKSMDTLKQEMQRNTGEPQ